MTLNNNVEHVLPCFLLTRAWLLLFDSRRRADFQAHSWILSEAAL